MLKTLRAKFHGIRVTASELDYHGSITLDPDQCGLAGIFPLEFVDIYNKNNGTRISTYVIYGVAGSRCCILNGAAARTCQPTDELIICASEYIANPEELIGVKPKVICFDANNRIREILEYEVGREAKGGYKFAVGKARLNDISKD